MVIEAHQEREQTPPKLGPVTVTLPGLEDLPKQLRDSRGAPNTLPFDAVF